MKKSHLFSQAYFLIFTMFVVSSCSGQTNSKTEINGKSIDKTERDRIISPYSEQEEIAQSTGTFTDSRDGQTYKIFSFKNASTDTTVIWLAQNLNYKVEGSYAYDDNENNRTVLGLLYTWEAAKKACPDGWHLPTDSEWYRLVSTFGGRDKAGKALKSVNGWMKEGNGTNSSGFNGLPGGHRRPSGASIIQGGLGLWWTSTPTGVAGKAWEWNMHFGGHTPDKPLLTKVFRFDADMLAGLSVRCVRD